MYREDILAHAYELAKANRGAPGVDGQAFEGIEARGLAKWLKELGNELRTKGKEKREGSVEWLSELNSDE